MRSPHILIVEDNDSAVFGYIESLKIIGYTFRIATDLKQAQKHLLTEQFDGVLLDLNLPDGKALPLIDDIKKNTPSTVIIVISGDSEIHSAVKAIKKGADNYLVKPVNMDELEVQLKNLLNFGRLRKKEEIRKNVTRMAAPNWGSSTAMQTIRELTETAADSDVPILIQGETGTGKGVLAKWIHEKSSRNGDAFIDMNCSTLSGELLKSELFGHAKGSFTSAVHERIGLVEAADNGTLFLDEIGDMDLELQTQLLKVIEEKSFRRLGENKNRNSDFRLICATHKDLKKAVSEGKFREDLFFRINVFPITLPPLRERKEDLPPLTEYLLKTLGYKHNSLDSDTIQSICNYNWPGNIRELKNCIERALLFSRRAQLNASHFPDLQNSPKINVISDDQLCSLAEMEVNYIKKALEMFKGDKSKVCEVLGISISSLYRKIPKLQEDNI